jgi:hypothetical protein
MIPLIRQAEQNAEFIVLVREPENAIRAFLRRGFYSRPLRRIWECCRLQPVGGFPPEWTPGMKATWLWCEPIA